MGFPAIYDHLKISKIIIVGTVISTVIYAEKRRFVCFCNINEIYLKWITNKVQGQKGQKGQNSAALDFTVFSGKGAGRCKSLHKGL